MKTITLDWNDNNTVNHVSETVTEQKTSSVAVNEKASPSVVADHSTSLTDLVRDDKIITDTLSLADLVVEDNLPRTFGYIRVSTREQNEARQVIALREFGVADENMIMDKQSGKDFDRPGYQRLLSILRPGDVFVVKSIDRLGRNYNEIIAQWRVITKEIGAAIVVIDMPVLDTRKDRDLNWTLISDIVLQLLSYVAETERTFIKERQREGIAAAKARGQRLGRKQIVKPEGFEEAVKMWRAHRLSSRKAAKRFGVSHTTFIRWAKEE